MKLWLHHINRVSENVEHLRRFYSDVMGLGEHTEDLPLCEPTRDYTGDVAFRTDDIEAFKKTSRSQWCALQQLCRCRYGRWGSDISHDPEGNVIEGHQAPDNPAIGGGGVRTGKSGLEFTGLLMHVAPGHRGIAQSVERRSPKP